MGATALFELKDFFVPVEMEKGFGVLAEMEMKIKLAVGNSHSFEGVLVEVRSLFSARMLGILYRSQVVDGTVSEESSHAVVQ